MLNEIIAPKKFEFSTAAWIQDESKPACKLQRTGTTYSKKKRSNQYTTNSAQTIDD